MKTAEILSRTCKVNDQDTFTKWKKFLQDDAKTNGGTATMLFLLHGRFVKVVADKDTVIVEFITEFDAAMEQILFFAEQT